MSFFLHIHIIHFPYCTAYVHQYIFIFFLCEWSRSSALYWICSFCGRTATDSWLKSCKGHLILTAKRLDHDSVQRGMAMWLPLGTHAGGSHLVSLQVAHTQVHWLEKRVSLPKRLLLNCKLRNYCRSEKPVTARFLLPFKCILKPWQYDMAIILHLLDWEKSNK